jgi:hypothetical protein
MRPIIRKSFLLATVLLAPVAVAGVSFWSATVTTDGRAPESMRGELVSDILQQWSDHAGGRDRAASQAWEARMRPRLEGADIANLERAASEPSFDGMTAALQGAMSDPRIPAKLGDPPGDLVFTPLTPCRIVDTRVAGGPLANNGSRNFIAYSPTGFAAQGGDGSDCGLPADVAAIAVKITASHPVYNGYFTAYASNVSRPLASSLNYFAGVDTSNSEMISLCRPACASQFALYTFAQSDAVIDVVGYFTEPLAGALDCTVAQQTGNLDLLSGLQTRSVSCPAGYSATGGGCGGPLGIGVSNSQPLVTSGQPTGWSCDLVGSLLSIISYQVNATCCRTAGR